MNQDYLFWVIPALLSATVYAGITIADKIILSNTALGLRTFLLFIGLVQGVISVIVMALVGVDSGLTYNLFASIAGGVIWSIALMLMFYVLQNEEVSRVTPVWQTSPLFASIFALIFLNEHISVSGWVAIALITSGAVVLSIDRINNVLIFKWTMSYVVLGAVMIGVAQNLLKIGSENLSIWENFWARGIGLSAGMLIVGARKRNFKVLKRFVSNTHTWYMYALFATEGIGPFLGNIFLLMALTNGPVSLVSALLGSRPVLVLIISLIISFFASKTIKESKSKKSIALKFASTVAIVAGVITITVYT